MIPEHDPRPDSERAIEKICEIGDASADHKPQNLSLDKVESFCDYLDSRGDALAPADSFETWLKEREDLI